MFSVEFPTEIHFTYPDLEFEHLLRVGMTADIEVFLSRIVHETCPTQIWSSTCQFFEEFGFRGVFQGVRHDGAALQASDTRMSSSISDWQAAYFAEGDHSRDPLFNKFPGLPSVFATGAEFLSDYPYLQDEDKKVIHRAADFGLISGMAIKMPHSDKSPNRGWHLLSDISKTDLASIQSRFGALFLVCATLAEEKIGQRMVCETLRLTARESECFTWLAAGLRTDQIADKIGIRPVTVDMHIKNARLRLGAKTREQALAIALNANLISI